MIFSPALMAQAAAVLDDARAKGLHIATAESCTGGLIAATLTEIAGSSDVFECGFVTYSNRAKEELLGVPHDVLEVHGAVSRETAQAMAVGTLRHSCAEVSVAVTGIAGPGGGTEEKPVGLVHIAAARGENIQHKEYRFDDSGRYAVRLETVKAALQLLKETLGG